MKKPFGHIRSYFRDTDKLLFFLVLATSLAGLLLVFIAYQAPDTAEKRTVLFTVGGLIVTRQFIVQCIAILLGFAAAIVISMVDYEAIASIWWAIAPVCIILVALTYFIGVGTDTAGANDAAWLKIPGVGLTFQPSELMKIGFIVTFSYHVSKIGDKVNT
ncbi:MAG: FtsW/RodA/SpoVE family cell cycle protein, partial [Clostridiales bacterium]|nr:FtsW/RodA/SpoVE family cell cycle protein [Clostridiales bacterium]